MQTHAYGYRGMIGPPRGVSGISVFRRLLGSADPPRGVYSISDFRRMLSAEHLLGECSLRLDSRQCVWMRTAMCLNALTVFLYKHRNVGGPYLDGDGLELDGDG